MPVTKAPAADLRRQYPRLQQIGLVLALALVVVAFTVPTARTAPPEVTGTVTVPLDLVPLPPTVEPPPPEAPPPAPPPPVEVDDATEVEAEVLEELVLDPDRFLAAPSVPPAPSRPPQPDVEPPPPPTLPDEADDVIIDVPDVRPELIGGLAGLQSRVEYPEFARRAGIEGQVVVQFVVDERGNVVDPVALRSPNDLLSEAAIKAVRESRFTPGQQRGRPVKVRFAVPVTFRLR